MSLQLAAQHLASRGRGPDSQLVHMAPQEVAGLQALAKAAGGTLTTNPDTGLPEAGILSTLLPVALGVALGPAGLGMSAAMAGLTTGAIGTLATGSLSKGLQAGFGAYGGAGLAGGLMGTGAQALGAETAAGMMGANQAAAMAPQTAAQLGSGFESAMAAQGATPIAQTAAQAMPFGYEAFGPTATNYGAFGEAPIQAAQAVQQAAPQTVTQIPTQPYSPEAIEAAVQNRMQNASISDKLSAGLGAYAKTPEALLTAENAKYGLAALGPAMLGAMTPQQAQYKGGSPNYEYTYDAGAGQYTRVPTGTRDALTQTPRMFYAEGGPVENMSARNAAMTLMADGGQMYADGGLSHLGDYSDGGRLLKGPGDGVSDSIPATIGDKRPARLADGEFVVPARIVSELGNGSTEAGARKLYAMMDRIQKARGKTTGKDRVAVNSRADKALPA